MQLFKWEVTSKVVVMIACLGFSVGILWGIDTSENSKNPWLKRKHIVECLEIIEPIIFFGWQELITLCIHLVDNVILKNDQMNDD
jgi:hypothetical protein